jgi:hypothetical protein
MMAWQKFSPGDPVIYRKSKCTARPGSRAVHVTPAPRGEDYVYEVDKFWVVVEMRPDRTLVLRTRRGKLHVVRDNDPHLRRPSLLERIRFGMRFPRTDWSPPSKS